MKQKKGKNRVAIIIEVTLVCVALVIAAGLFFTRNMNKSDSQISSERLSETLDRLNDKIDPKTKDAASEPLTDDEMAASMEDLLPDLDPDDLVVKGNGDVDLEIWSSPEKAGKGDEAWLVELAEQFNNEHHTTSDGKTVSISVRNISSGLANDYIVSGKAIPDLYTPSSSIWGKMIEASGTDISEVMDRTVGNVAGVFIRNGKYDQLSKEYGTLNMRTIAEATEEGKLQMGYTNPYTSTSGLNFLVSTLACYDSKDLLSDQAIEGFRAFQSKVPYVATTSNQMVKSAENGTFDAYIGESQQFHEGNGYRFIPYGVRHDNPLYAIGTLNDAEKEGLEQFKTLLESEEARNSASQKGFNQYDSYASELGEISGDTYRSAQKVWKSEKNSGRTVVAFFVADMSGSMAGSPEMALKTALLKTMPEISDSSYVGLISYADDVTIELPLSPFDLPTKALFKGAVKSMMPSGQTATNDAIVVALKQIQDFRADHPDLDIQPAIILLSDGVQNTGYSLNDIRKVMSESKVPIHTIGYNLESGDAESLRQIADVNEASATDADSADIITRLRDLFRINL